MISISICPSNSREQPTPPEQEVSHPPHPPAGNLPTPPVDNPPMQHRGPQQVNQIQQQPENTHVNMFVVLLMQSHPSFYKQHELQFTTQMIRVSFLRQDLFLTLVAKDHT